MLSWHHSKPRSDQSRVPLMFKCLEKALVNSSELLKLCLGKEGGARNASAVPLSNVLFTVIKTTS